MKLSEQYRSDELCADLIECKFRYRNFRVNEMKEELASDGYVEIRVLLYGWFGIALDASQ